MGCRRAIQSIVLAALIHPLWAEAGVVNGVSVSPPGPTVNQAATVTVTGTNPCGAVLIDFGDGQATTVQTPMPIQVQHTWTTVGMKKVTAKGAGTNCSGEVSVSVDVKTGSILGNAGELCKAIDCHKLFGKPVISSFFGFATPGGVLAVIGKYFGTKPGSVTATLQTWNGGTITKNLKVIEWTNTMVGVEWPTDITGVRQQQGNVVVKAGTMTSDPRALAFFPTDDHKVLGPGDVKVISCGDDGNADKCNNQIDPDDEGWFFPAATQALDGFHMNVWGAIGDDTGTDSYQIALKNDWVMQSFFWDVDVDAGEGWAQKPSGFTQGANWAPQVKWSVTPNDNLYYHGTVTIVGPLGVPFK
jgi:hypothetical protein